MSGTSCWRLWLAVFFLVAGVDAIEIGFSVSDGDESLSIVDSYEVDDSISVSETGVAQAQSPVMRNSREVQGSGDADMTQIYSSGAYNVLNHAYAEGSQGINLRTAAIMSPCYFDLSQSLDISGGHSRYVLSGDYWDEGVLQYAEVSMGSLTSTQSLTLSGDGIYSLQNTAASGLNPRAFGSAGKFSFDPLSGEILGTGGFVGLGVLGMGQISALLQANTVAGQPSTTSVSGSNLDARTEDVAFVTAGAGEFEGNLNDGQIDAQGAVALGGVVNGQFSGEVSALTERVVNLPSCTDPTIPDDPQVSINLVAKGDVAFEGVAAGDVKLNAPRGSLEGQGSLVAVGAVEDASVEGSLYAKTIEGASTAGGTDIEGSGDTIAAAGAASGGIRADLFTATFEGDAALVGAGAAGQNSIVHAGILEAGTGSAYAYGSDIWARGDEFALTAAGAGNLMMNPNILRGEAAMVGVGASKNGRVNATTLYAKTQDYGTYAYGEGLSGKGDDAAVALAGAGRVEMTPKKTVVEGALAGVGAGANGRVDAEHLSAGYSEYYGSHASGSGITGKGDDAAVALAGAGRVEIKPKKTVVEGALAGVGAGVNGRVDAEYLSAGYSEYYGSHASGGGITGKGDDAAVALAGAGHLTVVETDIEAHGAIVGLAAFENCKLEAVRLEAVSDASRSQAEGGSLFSKGDGPALVIGAAGRYSSSTSIAQGDYAGAGAWQNAKAKASSITAYTDISTTNAYGLSLWSDGTGKWVVN